MPETAIPSRAWQHRFDGKPISPNPYIAELDIERNELAHTWKRFTSLLLPQDQVQWEERPQTVLDVQTLLGNIKTFWMSGPRQRVFSDSMDLCDRLLPTMDTHATLLSTLPDPMAYTPLFYGVLQSVIKASSHYPRVMEGLATALLNIHDALGLPSHSGLISNAFKHITKTYALIFFFLTEFMDWYVQRSTCQLLNIHSQDMYSEFHHLVLYIQLHAQNLPWQHAAIDVDEEEDPYSPRADPYSPRALWEKSRLSQVGCRGTERRVAAKDTIIRRLLWEIQQDAEERIRYREGKHLLLAETLSSVREQLEPVNEQSSGIICITTPPAPNIDTSSFKWSRGSKRRLARREIQSSSKYLQDFFDSDDQIYDYEPEVKVIAEGSIVASLQQWATSSGSQALAVGGTQPTASLAPVALISACYASFARQARLPVVSHFCALPSQEAKGLNIQEQGLIALTYSIIRQLIDWLPPIVESDAVLDLSAERIRQLDGTLTSWKAAISLVDTLLQSAPPILVFIIDGLDAIHTPSTDGAIRELVRLLLTHTRRQPQGGLNGQGPTLLLKVLFTVTGRPSALLETMSEHTLILTESNKTSQPMPSESVLTSDLGAVIDAGIPETKNMDHILDAARYFSELDLLELRTAQILGMKNGPYIKLESLHDCLECLGNWQAALRYLQSQGFCGTTMSILIEDQDRDGIASAVHVSLSQVGTLLQTFVDPFKDDASKRFTKNWIQMLLNVEDKALSDFDSVEILRFLCTILSIGIVSFSGSHVCRFDDNLWDQEMEEIAVGFDGYAFKPRNLACLDDFIGGPAWILGKASAPSEGMKISFTVQDLQELWGPVSLVGDTTDEAPVIQTERGFIIPLPRERQSSLSTSSLRDEIECHWVTEIPEYLPDQSSDMSILIRNSSRILIGTTTDVEAGLVVNDKCTSSISVIGQQIAYRLQYPGTSKSRYVSDGYDVQLVGGQYATAGLVKKYKRIPKRTLKAMLIADCTKPDTRLVPLLNLRVGLEVSVCTGNAQRVTLWDALRFSQTSAHPTNHLTYCAHNVGDKNCISSCWTRWRPMDEIDSLDHMPGQNKLLNGVEARRVIINSILALENSGVDSEGNLQVCWPFSNSPANCPVLPSTPKESHNWFRVVKDTRDTSSFAVFSQRCLEFPENGIMRSCSAPCKEGHFKPLQTTLLTRILTLTEERSVSELLVGVKFLVGETHLTVTKAVQDQFAIIAAVSMNPLNPLRYRLREILPDARAFDFKEHIWPDITAGLSVPVFVY
ncbi:hypothetical protein N7467_010438 [Penicillium canescens]|nr:hypothetical protein N7467_010438 [Penicillium canescens]